MKDCSKLLGVIGIGFAALASNGQPAFASCPGYTAIHICPAGGFEYEFHVPLRGCGHLSPPSVSLPSFVNDDRIFQRCERNNFPRYRRFTHEEGATLDALVDTPEYLERMDWPYGALSIWVEEQLTGNIPPGWVGRQTILDAYLVNAQARRKLATFRAAKRREKEAAARLQTAFSVALPNLITAARTSEKVGLDRAREAADIAYLLQFDGRVDEARAWLKLSFGVLDALSEEERRYSESTRSIVESVSVCVESAPQEREALCGRGGVYQFARNVLVCLRASSASSCDVIKGWPKEPEALAIAVHDKRVSNPLFKKLFDRGLTHYPFGKKTFTCDDRAALGLECVPGPLRHKKQTIISTYMPDLATKIDNFGTTEPRQALARLLLNCEMFKQPKCAGADTQTAIEKGRKLFPEFSEAYSKYRDEEASDAAERAAKCAVTNLLFAPVRACHTDAFSPVVDRNSKRFRQEFEKVKRRSLEEYVETLAQCRLRDALGREPASRCDTLSHDFQTFEAAEGHLRPIVPDFDRVYAVTFDSAIGKTAKALGSFIAAGELRPSEVQANRSQSVKLPTAKEGAEKARQEAVELIRLYPQTRDMIEKARLESLEEFTTPR